MTRNRALVAVLAALALFGLGVLSFGLFVPAASSREEDALSRATAASSRRPVERRSSRSRLAMPLVPPRAEVERATGAASIAGRVIDDMTGRGVANATLTFLSSGNAFSADATNDGSFTLEGLVPGVYELYAIGAPGYAPFERGGVTLRVEPDTRLRDVTFSLRALWFVEGKVTDPTGAPVDGAEVRGVDGDADPSSTNAEGAFSIECSLGAVLEARHPRFAPGQTTCDRSARLGRPVAIRLAERAATAARGSIAGRVVGADGRGIEGAFVVAERRDARGSPSEVLSAADGGFSLEALETGSYDVSAASGRFPKSIKNGVRTGERELVLRIAPGGRLQGIVRERGNAGPIAGFSIALWPMRGAFERGPPQVQSFIAPDGRFEIDALLPGEYSVTAISSGRPSADEQRVAIAAGTVRNVVLELTTGGRVFGTVQDVATGKPIAGAQVALESALGDEHAAVPLLASSASDEGGAFELRGVGAGRFSLSVSAAAHHHKLTSGLTLRAGAELGPLRIDLEPTAPGEEPKLELQGIGAVLRIQGDAILVGYVVPDAGAARAGLIAGDRILSVDGVPVTALGFQGTLEQIRGPEGTAVRLEVRRGETVLHLVAERRRMRR